MNKHRNRIINNIIYLKLHFIYKLLINYLFYYLTGIMPNRTVTSY